MILDEDRLRAAYREPPDDAALDRLRATIHLLGEPAGRSRQRRSRLRWLVPVVAAVAVVAVFVTIANLGPTHRPAPNAEPAASGTAQPDLAAALRPWTAFPVTASPRPLVLAGPDIIDPPTGFLNDDQKVAYLSGSFELPGTLPSGSPVVNGQQLVSAAQALADLRHTGRSDKPEHSPLVITKVRLGTGKFITDRGVLDLPGWAFWFAGVEDPAVVLAIPRTDRWPHSDQPTFDQDPMTAAVSDDGTRVTLTFMGWAPGTGPCQAEYAVDSKQTDTAVAVSVRELPRATLPRPSDGRNYGCDLAGHTRTATFTLQRPLGNRVLVDAHGIPLGATPSR